MAKVSSFGDSRPFKSNGNTYVDLGWLPFPLPAKSKMPPKGGVTGQNGVDPTSSDIEHWIGRGQANDRNIASRMPQNVIGFDVDDYGDKQGGTVIRELQEKWGDLPDTWTVSARSDGISGTRFYRIPPELWDLGFMLGNGVDIIRHKHRYSVMPPSVHPDGGVYRGYWPGNFPDGESWSQDIFPVKELPDLPENWCKKIQSNGHLFAKLSVAPMSNEDTMEWLDNLANSEDKYCNMMQKVRDKYVLALENGEYSKVGNGGGRHETLCSGLFAIVMAASEGHAGGKTAVNELIEAFVAAMAA